MRKSKLIASIVLGLILVTSLCGCSDIVIGGKNGKIFSGNYGGDSAYYYEGSNYLVGNATVEEAVDSLAIDWVSGEIELRYHDDDTIVIEEESKTDLSDREKLRYICEDGTLRIKYVESGVMINKILTKKLTVTLPKDIDFKKVDINTVSSNLKFDTLKADSMNYNAVSGDISANTIEVADDFVINTVSGEVSIEGSISGKSLKVNTVSGGMDARLNISDRFDYDTMSGEAKIELEKMCDIDIDSVSGNANIILPESPSYTLKYDTVSGYISMGNEAKINNNVYTVGNGEKSIKVDTVSGNLTIG